MADEVTDPVDTTTPVETSTQASDTGTLSAADQERIFNKYTRLYNKENLRGHGLGLAYCRLAVEGHGGRIWVDSQSAPGATFRFILPISLDKDDETASGV